jgi:two-component system, cell cycle sensor histidine kinase and response regulator CckA
MELRTESEKRFRTIFDSSNDALLICDKNTGEILYVNEKVCEMFGYTYSEVIDNNISMIREDETLQTKDNNIESFVNSSKKSYEGECKATHKNGNVFWVEVSIKDVTIDNQNRALIAIRDISQRKQAEEDRRLSEIKYRNIFERSIEGIFQSTYEGKILSVNPAMARIYGYDSPEDILRDVETAKNTYVNSEERTRFLDHLERYGRIEGFEAQFYTKDRKIIWVSLSARTVSDIDGKVLYYEGTAMDITTRKKAEEEKERLEAQLRQSQKIEAIGTLAGGIAHDFNNILSVVSGYGSILQMELEKADSPLRNYASQILLASEKAVGLTKSLLAFSRKQPVQLQPLKLNEIINGVHKLLETLLTEDIVMQKNLSEKDIVIMGDATQIDQILFNLATNARDAMPGGGSLTVETRLMELKDGFTDILGYVEPGMYALLSVSDTGNGIDEKTKEHIFDPFFTTKDVGKGTGLGLSTVYGVVKQHNGYITVYSELGMGTTFHIYFPALLSKIEDKKIESSPTEGGNETILIAEDNESVRYLMKTILTKFGYNIIEAKDGEEAVQKYRENEIIDLMIIDSVMPKKNGREVYDEIKKDEPDIKVLFTSGYTRDIVLDKGIEEKEVEFISKPLSPNALLKKVRRILDAH